MKLCRVILFTQDFNKIQIGLGKWISILLSDGTLVFRAQIRAMRNQRPETFCQTQVSHISELILIDVTAC